jgi:hypothetical protein
MDLTRKCINVNYVYFDLKGSLAIIQMGEDS